MNRHLSHVGQSLGSVTAVVLTIQGPFLHYSWIYNCVMSGRVCWSCFLKEMKTQHQNAQNDNSVIKKEIRSMTT